LVTPGEACGGSVAAPQLEDQSAPLVAFDFDGTLTTTDSFIAFLRWRTTRAGWALGLLRLTPGALAYLVRRDRGRLKSAAVGIFLQGLKRDLLRREAARFADEAWDGLMRPDALARWSAHQARGDRLTIVTASPEEVVEPFARRLGADALIGSRLAWTPDGRVGPGLAGENCRGGAKVARLRERFGPDVNVTAAYGDTSGDREMLAFAADGRMRMFRARAGSGRANSVSRARGARSRPSGSVRD
jgi:phosphatidylglycerophosphatase C